MKPRYGLPRSPNERGEPSSVADTFLGRLSLVLAQDLLFPLPTLHENSPSESPRPLPPSGRDETRQRGCGREALGRPLPGYCGGSESGPGAASPGRKSHIAGDPRWDREATHSCFSPELPESGRRTPGAVPRQHPVPTHPASAPLGGLRSCHVISTKRGGP